MNYKKLCLFDLDGVILDSKKNMKVAWSHVNKIYKLNISFNKYFALIGKDFKEILKELGIEYKYFSGIEKNFKDKSISNFNIYKLYPKVRLILKILKTHKIKTGLVTSKDCFRTKKVLKKFSLKFDEVRCSDGKLNSKPKPDKILSIIRKLKIKKKNTIYVGDMLVDKLTAQNAGVDYIHASYGYSKKIKHVNLIKSFDEIIKFL
jgi:phosphoglycolate phosphatase